MDKEIPNLKEKSTRAARLREACRRLQDFPLDRLPSEAEWEAVTEDLSRDDLDHLKKLAAGYRDRAIEGQGPGFPADLEEAASALLLWPLDPSWTNETAGVYRQAGWKGPEAEAFLATLDKRIGKKPKKPRPVWLLPFFITLVALPAGVGLMTTLWTMMNQGKASPIQGPRNLEAVFDTQGVKTNIQVARSRMILFPDSTVAEISAWVTFPEHRVDLWEGTVSVLDSQGEPLARRDVIFHASKQGSLEPGQGIEVFQQFDAHPFYSKVSSFQVLTTRILAQEAHPKDRKEMPVQGLESLTAGYNLKIWAQDNRWTDRFASRVNTLNLELENTGLKSFGELEFALIWRDSLGKTLKTLLIQPVSAFRSVLPSGGRLPWTQETIFDTEVFSWPAGGEPHPTLELRQWQ